MTALTPARQNTTQLFIIDKNVDGWRDLVNNAGIGVSVLILDPLQDGLTQIANAITAYSNLDAIHILSHGSVASLQLGSATLNSDNLNHYTEQLTTIGNALSENGDLLLYGCNVAQGDIGQQFIEQLSVLTGADVAASTDLTGDANQGGDWVLESQTGAIEAASVITEEAQATYHNTLATTVGVFAATDAANGTELWVTDGTAAGTSLLKDIYVGMLSSSPHAITSLGNGKAVFVATGITSPSNYSYDVWITDGTTSTILVKDIRSPYSDSQFFFTSLGNGKALFSGFDSNLNRNLWVTDGTAAGTNTIAIAIGLFIYYPESIAVLGNGKALFSTHDSTNGAGLWITDGTTAGTSLVKSFFDGTPSSYPPQYLTSLSNGKALFSAGNAVNGAELWITDGTTAGTVLVKDINAGTSSSHPQSFTDLSNGKAVFNAYNTTTGHELWVTDGTAVGTNLVKNGIGSFDSTSFTVLGNGKVLFSSTLGLWVTDATAAGTTLVKNIFIGTGDQYSQIITSLGNGKALFSAYDSTNGYELWVSDGTTAGTNLVKDINTGINSSKPQFFTALGNGKATFSATDANNDTELWITDGTAAGTSRLKDVNNDGDSSDPQSFATLGNGTVLFSAYDAINGTELWITDGIAAGTSLVKDIYAGITSSNPQSLTSLGNGKVLFKAGINDYIGGNEDLWVSDGTAAGTSLLKAATGVSYPSFITVLNNGKAVFDSYDTINGTELWITDGTAAGTSLVNAGTDVPYIQSAALLANGKTVLSSYDAINGTELWITDGTPAGTNLVKDIFTGTDSSNPHSFTTLSNGKVLFRAHDISGTKLWVTDGTTAGTTILAETGNESYLNLGGKQVFNGYDAINGLELLITDGTAAGTNLVKDIFSGTGSSNPMSFTALGNGKAVFSALDATNGRELWITDGTAAGTSLVKDIVAGIGSSNPESFTLLANGKVVFSAFDAVNGRELWITDGTGAGTSLVKDINTLATQSSYPSAVTLITGANTNTNTAPTVLAGTTTVFTEQTPITVAGTITINDPNGDADWNGGTLQVQITANNTINDGLALPTANNGGVWLNAGNVLMANTTVIGGANAATVSNGSAWLFTFNAAATNALVQDTARAIQFTNNSDAPNTAARTVMFTVTDKNAASNSAIQTVSVTAVNDAPTITAFLTPVGTGNEDSEIPITFATLQSQGNAADVDGTVTAFVIKTVNSGTLRIGTDALTATAWSASNNSVDASHQAYWTPALNTNGTLNVFTAVAKDNSGLESITPVQATVTIAAVNDAPTLTSFTSVVASGNEDSEIPITFANLQTQGNEADIDGTVTAFVIKAVNSGTLRIGTDAITATAWSASNNSVDASHQAYWTPALNTNGTLNAFTAVAKDNSGLESMTPVQATVSVSAVNDAPTLTSFTAAVASGNEDSEIPITFASLQAQGNEVDVDGSIIAFLIKSVSSGTLKIGTSAATASDWNALLNYIVDATHQAYWTPAPNANGTLNAFTVTARDNGGLESVTPVQATVSGVAVIDATVSLGITPVEGGTVGTFIVTLDSAVPIGGLTVNYTLAGTATLTTDYTVTAGSNITTMTGSSFTIAAGQTTAVLNVNALSDIVADSNETIVLNLTTGVGYQLPTLFSPKVDYMTGFMPYSVSVGDVNNDGKLDLVVANKYSNTVSVLLRNLTNTSFDTKVDYVTGTAPNSVSVGDFNSDGKLDLAVANSSSNTVSVLLRNTTNTGFNAKVDYATGIQPASVSVGDFNNDGKLDLAVANSSSNTVSVLLRNAANTGFDTKVDYATGSYPDSISVGDFNNDGKLDLAVANSSSNTVSILLRNATNTGFDAKVDYATGINPFSISTGDFNNDGKLDLAIANYSSNTVSVLMRNTANTGFDAKVDYATGSSLWAVSVADFNNDGKLDLVAVPNGNTVSVFLRNTANTGFDTKIDYATGVTSMSVVNVGDFNNDGKTDLVVANGSSNINTVSVLLNNSNHILTITDTPSNIAPTLTTFSSVVATGSEDSQIKVSFADLQTQGNEADVDGTVTAFVIKAVNTGTLKIGTDAVTATAWSVSNNTVDASHQAYWTPALNANGTLNAFTAVAKDNGGLESITPVQATVSITAVNDAPTLTTFTSSVATGNEDSEIPVTFASLQSQGNAADIDGTVTAFVIKAVNSGALRIGTDALTATAWSAVNNSVDASHQAYWTPALNTNGVLNAFTVVAKDNGDLESITPVQTTVTIAAVNDAPTLTSFTAAVASGNENSEIPITFASLQSQGNAADIDGTVTAFVIKTVNSGTLRIGTDALTATAWSASNNSVDASHQAYWTPALNTNGTLNAFTAVAKDNGGLESMTPVQATVSITAVNNSPVLAHVLSDQTTNQSIAFSYTIPTDSFTDVDAGDTLSYQASQVDGSVLPVWLSFNAATRTFSGTPSSANVGVLSIKLTATDSAGTNASDDFVLTITGGNNVFKGGAGSDVLNGSAGNDTLDAGVSNDYNPSVVDRLNGGAGDDTFLSRGFYGHGIYNGGAGSDGLDFSQPNFSFPDFYTAVRRGAEGAGVKVDLAAGVAYTYYRVADNFTWTDANGQIAVTNIENVRGTAQSDNLKGDGNANVLDGGGGKDILNGGAGADTLIGGTGNDTYYVDNVGDVVIEKAFEGNDGVWSSLSDYTLAANVESLGLLTGALNGTGNAGDNYLLGNAANNSLDGGTGADTLVGGLGNDSYYVDNIGDVVTENTGEGFDIVYSSLSSYTIGVNIEALVLRDAANINGVGNDQNNVLIGNTGDNSLDGGAGSDTINGGTGNDTLDGGASDVYNSGTVDTLNGEAGNDTFLSRGFYGHGNYTGGDGSDTLDFSQPDSYTVVRRIIEGAGVNVDLAAGNASTYYRVADNFTWTDANGQIAVASIENVRGTNQSDRLLGDNNANVLEGGEGNDVLNGGAGADTLIGGTGNDTYYVDNTGDVVTETVSGGTDGVWSSLSDYTLADNVESFGLLAGALNGTGNAGDNYLLGNAANNSLTGGEGADTLVGGLGKDTYNLTETIATTDTLYVSTGDSLVSGYDIANAFKLGTGIVSTAGVDKLDLASNLIAANTAAVNGTNSGIIASHSISNGIISFDDIDNYTAPLAITATNLANVFGYLQANIIGGNTVAFISESNTFVFQDGGINDTLVELVGVIATSVNTTGLAAGAVWVV
jgi:ELWxxDGT repeat protein